MPVGPSPPSGRPLHAVLLAGGTGERLWPLSTPERPKPFARLFAGESLLGAALRRAAALAPPERTWVLGGAAHEPLLRLETEGRVPPANLLLEPERRDTAAAVALAAAAVAAREPQALLAVLPSDNHVPDPGPFVDAVRRAAAAAGGGYLTCIGTAPLRPDTRFGYIEAAAGEVAPGVRAVRRFVEKPPREAAERLLASGSAFWNAGVVVAGAVELRRAFAEHFPAIGAAMADLEAASAPAGASPPAPERLARLYRALPSISFDYAVLQRAGNVAVAPAAFRWHDVGSWAELPRVEADGEGNFVRGPARLVDTRDSVVYNLGSAPVVVHGLEGMLVAVLPGPAVLVGPLAADGRALLRRLAESGGVPECGPPAWLEAAGGGVPPDGADPAAAAASPLPRTRVQPWGREVVWADTADMRAAAVHVRGGSCGTWACPQGWAGHLWFLGGAGWLRRGDERWPIRPGLCLREVPGAPLGVEATEDTAFLSARSPARP